VILRVRIREYSFDDAEGHAEVHRKSIRGIASKDYRDEVIEAWDSKEPEDSPLNDKKVRFVAEEDGELVGFSDYNKESNELTGVYVKPASSRQGTGEKLLQKVEQDAKKNGLDRLWCKSTVTAKDFYQKHGYEITAETTHELEDGIEMKAYKMRKRI
jgi:putative acetyltransferase